MRKGSMLVAAVATFAVVGAVGPSAAVGQTTQPATVTAVTDGDTLTARTADGRHVPVGILGIDAPQPGECGGRDARAALEALVAGQAVELETDPAVPSLALDGKSRVYVDRADGLDVGLQMLRLGWATVVVIPSFAPSPQFARLPSYREAEEEALEGVWTDCSGDFHLSPEERLIALGHSAQAFARRYYRRVSNDQFRAAWRMLATPAKRRLGYGFRRWRSSHRGSLSVSARTPGVVSRGNRAVVRVRLRSRDRDVCSGRVVVQRFRGTVTVVSRDGSLAILRFRIRKTSGATPRRSKSQCPRPTPAPAPVSPPPSSVDCQGYDPCLLPGPDVDCAGGSGNGPRYVDGPVSVSGSDPYDLDGNGDGVGCED
ncbi:MAG TPA: hypothetical protein VEX36_07745 [Thermoleophilaceae bacterium]|nr:hypothetical protein [Thermoleophilaceae bacterium]